MAQTLDLTTNLISPEKVLTKEIIVKKCKHFVYYQNDKKSLYIDSTPTSEFIHFKFEYALDTFQQQSIIAIENKENVLVSAHTSAGKTTVAI